MPRHPCHENKGTRCQIGPKQPPLFKTKPFSFHCLRPDLLDLFLLVDKSSKLRKPRLENGRGLCVLELVTYKNVHSRLGLVTVGEARTNLKEIREVPLNYFGTNTFPLYGFCHKPCGIQPTAGNWAFIRSTMCCDLN